MEILTELYTNCSRNMADTITHSVTALSKVCLSLSRSSRNWNFCKEVLYQIS